MSWTKSARRHKAASTVLLAPSRNWLQPHQDGNGAEAPERQNMAKKLTPEPTAPVLWTFTPAKSPASGIYIDDTRCWMGNDIGQVFALDHEGNVQRHYKLPKGVM